MCFFDSKLRRPIRPGIQFTVRSDRKTGLIRSVPERQPPDSRLSCLFGIICQHFIGRKITGIVTTVCKIAIDDSFYLLQQSILPELVHHPVDAV